MDTLRPQHDLVEDTEEHCCARCGFSHDNRGGCFQRIPSIRDSVFVDASPADALRPNDRHGQVVEVPPPLPIMPIGTKNHKYTCFRCGRENLLSEACDCGNKPLILDREAFLKAESRWDEPKPTPVREAHDHPSYYGGKDNVYECIKVIEAWKLGYNLGSLLKYISRAGKKDPAKHIEDLKKSRWYLDREIENLEKTRT